MAHARQWLMKRLHGERPSLTDNLRPTVFLPESLTGIELLENFKNSGVKRAFIVAKYIAVQGIVTLQDVTESITGEFKMHLAEHAWTVQREDRSWLLEGLIPVPEPKDRLGVKGAPEEERGRYIMLMLLMGRLPQTADCCAWDNRTCESVDLDGKRIDKMLAFSAASAEKSTDPAPD